MTEVGKGCLYYPFPFFFPQEDLSVSAFFPFIHTSTTYILLYQKRKNSYPLLQGCYMQKATLR